MKEYEFSLLFLEKCRKFDSTPPVFFVDLQLEEVCRAIVSKYMEFDIRKYFYTIPDTIETIRYRQDIYRDLENNEEMILSLKKYTNRLLTCEKCFRFYRQVEDEVKKGSYLLLTCQNYLTALELLRETLQKAEITSEGLTECRRILEEKFSDTEFEDFCKNVKKCFSDMEKMKLTLLIRDKEISVLEEEEAQKDEESVVETLKRYIRAFEVPVEEDWENQPEEVSNLFPAPLETGPLENTIVDILKKSRPGVFQMLREFASFDFSPEGDMFLNLKNEFIFYISFFEFEKQLLDAGYKLQFPTAEKSGGVELTAAYDLALAWKNRFSGYAVVPNDISYQAGKSFLVITGPNQGGKTTLARAVGQCIYFMLVGLKAPCGSMKARYFERILTHFEVEESVETGAGKLKEELQRLKPMMSIYANNSFVILNELFTTATTYDAQIMAKKVMEHFIQNGCLGIYVTHIQELADETVQDGVQSMVAQIDEQDPARRTFKILPMKAQGLGYSDFIVKKYGLSFDQVTERVSDLK